MQNETKPKERPATSRILIVEDEGIVAKDIRRRLERMGHIVTGTADNASDALLLTAETRPDLVLMDIIIQGDMDGIETAIDLKRMHDVPVIFLTAHSDRPTLERAKRAMPYGYLIKPFEERELATTIEMALYRHQAERRIREQAALLDNASDAIITCDVEWRIVSWNRGAERMYGWQAAEVLDKAVGLLDPDDSASAVQKAHKALRHDGKWEGEARHLTRDGRELLVLARQSVFEDQAGHPRAILMLTTDITEKRAAEERLYQTQRLESIGNLASGVAHDLNNALAPILIGAQLLKMEYPNDSSLTEMIETSAQRGANLVRQLLNFARGMEGDRICLQPVHLLKEMETMMRGTFPKNVRIVTNWDQDLPNVTGDSTQLHQILLNFCVNARDAMPDGGTLTLEARHVEVDSPFAQTIRGASPGKYVTLQVSDTGTGIPPEILDRIFDPFFTTKSPGQGTGLGLSTVAGIIKGHGGFLQVDSETGKGSTFTAYLPADGAEADATPPAINGEVKFRGEGQTVMLVDDEAGLRDIGRHVLRRMNLVPVVAADGTEGLILATEHRTDLRAIIVDMHMPHLDGLGFVRKIRPLLPNIPIVVASGGASPNDVKEFDALGVKAYLDKPFTEGALATVLKDLLSTE